MDHSNLEVTRSMRRVVEADETHKNEDVNDELDTTQELSAAEIENLNLQNKVAAAEEELEQKIDEVSELELELQTLQEINARRKEDERTPESELRLLKEKIYSLKNDIGHLRDLVWAKAAIEVKNRGLENYRNELTGVNPESDDFKRLKQAIEELETDIVRLTSDVTKWDRHKRNPRLRVVTDPDVEAVEEEPLIERSIESQIKDSQIQLIVREQTLKKLEKELQLPIEQRQSRLDDDAIRLEIDYYKKLAKESQDRIAQLEQTTGEMPAVAA